MGKYSALEKCILTKNWTIDNRAALAYFLERQSLKSGEYLFYENSSEKKMYILDQGCLRVESGKHRIELESGASIGELSLLLETEKQVRAFALEDCQFWVMTEQKWQQIRAEAPPLAMMLVEAIVQKFGKLLHQTPKPPVSRKSSKQTPEASTNS